MSWGLARSETDVFIFDEGDAPETSASIERREKEERLQRQREQKEARQIAELGGLQAMCTSIEAHTKEMYGNTEEESEMYVNVQDEQARGVEQRAHSIPRSAQPTPPTSSTTIEVEEVDDHERSSQSSDSDDVEEVFSNAQVEASNTCERPTPMRENENGRPSSNLFSIFTTGQQGAPPPIDENQRSTNARGGTTQSPTPQVSMDAPPTTSTDDEAPPSRVYVVRQDESRTNFGFGVLMSKGAGRQKLNITEGGTSLSVMIGYRILYQHPKAKGCWATLMVRQEPRQNASRLGWDATVYGVGDGTPKHIKARILKSPKTILIEVFKEFGLTSELPDWTNVNSYKFVGMTLELLERWNTIDGSLTPWQANHLREATLKEQALARGARATRVARTPTCPEMLFRALGLVIDDLPEWLRSIPQLHSMVTTQGREYSKYQQERARGVFAFLFEKVLRMFNVDMQSMWELLLQVARREIRRLGAQDVGRPTLIEVEGRTRARGDESEWENLKSSKLVQNLRNTYNACKNPYDRAQVLSHLVPYGFKAVATWGEEHDVDPKITERRFRSAKIHRIVFGAGGAYILEDIHRTRHSLRDIEEMMGFILGTKYVENVAYGTKHLYFEDGTHVVVATLVRKEALQKMWEEYQQAHIDESKRETYEALKTQHKDRMVAEIALKREKLEEHTQFCASLEGQDLEIAKQTYKAERKERVIELKAFGQEVQIAKRQFYNGMGRSTFKQAVRCVTSGNTKALAALDNVTVQHGNGNFKLVGNLLQELWEVMDGLQGNENRTTLKVHLSKMIKEVLAYELFLKREFQSHLQDCSKTASHCITFMLGGQGKHSMECGEGCAGHPLRCGDCEQMWTIPRRVHELVQGVNEEAGLIAQEREDNEWVARKFENSLLHYVRHLVRLRHEAKNLPRALESLRDDPTHLVVVCDWKMRWLFHVYREAQAQFFGKAGVVWHGCMLMSLRKDEQDIDVEYVDGLSDDRGENAPETIGQIYIALVRYMRRRESEDRPIKSITLFTDGAGCYKGKYFILTLLEMVGWLNDKFPNWDIQIKEQFCGEAGGNKTSLDGHFGVAGEVAKRAVASGTQDAVDAPTLGAALKGVKNADVILVDGNPHNVPIMEVRKDALVGISHMAYRQIHYEDEGISLTLHKHGNLGEGELVTFEMARDSWESGPQEDFHSMAETCNEEEVEICAQRAEELGQLLRKHEAYLDALQYSRATDREKRACRSTYEEAKKKMEERYQQEDKDRKEKIRVNNRRARQSTGDLAPRGAMLDSDARKREDLKAQDERRAKRKANMDAAREAKKVNYSKMHPCSKEGCTRIFMRPGNLRKHVQNDHKSTRGVRGSRFRADGPRGVATSFMDHVVACAANTSALPGSNLVSTTPREQHSQPEMEMTEAAIASRERAKTLATFEEDVSAEQVVAVVGSADAEFWLARVVERGKFTRGASCDLKIIFLKRGRTTTSRYSVESHRVEVLPRTCVIDVVKAKREETTTGQPRWVLPIEERTRVNTILRTCATTRECTLWDGTQVTIPIVSMGFASKEHKLVDEYVKTAKALEFVKWAYKRGDKSSSKQLTPESACKLMKIHGTSKRSLNGIQLFMEPYFKDAYSGRTTKPFEARILARTKLHRSAMRERLSKTKVERLKTIYESEIAIIEKERCVALEVLAKAPTRPTFRKSELLDEWKLKSRFSMMTAKDFNWQKYEESIENLRKVEKSAQKLKEAQRKKDAQRKRRHDE